jgi:hypothetical protein
MNISAQIHTPQTTKLIAPSTTEGIIDTTESTESQKCIQTALNTIDTMLPNQTLKRNTARTTGRA